MSIGVSIYFISISYQAVALGAAMHLRLEARLRLSLEGKEVTGH